MNTIQLSLMDDTNEKIVYVASLPKDAFLNGDFTSKCKTTLALRPMHR